MATPSSPSTQVSDLHIKGSTREILDMLQKAEIIEEATKSKPHFDWSKIDWKDIEVDRELRNQDSLSAQTHSRLSESDKSPMALDETAVAIRSMSQILVDSEHSEAQKKGVECAEKLGSYRPKIEELNVRYTDLFNRYNKEIKTRFKDIKKLDGQLFLGKQRTLNEKLEADQKTSETRREDLMKTLEEKTTSFINEAKDYLKDRETLISNLNQIYQEGLPFVEESKRSEIPKARTITPSRRI